MRTVAEAPTFTRQAEKLFDENEKAELISFLADNPLSGDVIPDTGGVRKVRFAASGRGKRGGARVVYYFLDDSIPLYALLVYQKNEKVDLTPEEKRARGCDRGCEEEEMTVFGEDLIQSLGEALAHVKGEGPAVVHAPVNPREVRKHAGLTQAEMAPLMGMSLSGYRKWEQGQRAVSGPAAMLLRVIAREPEAVKRALVA